MRTKIEVAQADLIQCLQKQISLMENLNLVNDQIISKQKIIIASLESQVNLFESLFEPAKAKLEVVSGREL